MTAAIDALMSRLERQGLALEAEAVRLVRRMYGRLNLADLVVLIQAISGRDLRLTAADRAQLQAAFDAATAAMGASPGAFTGLLTQAVEQGVSGGLQMMTASGMVLDAFRGTPDLQVAYLDRSLKRFEEFWGAERSRFATEVHQVLVDGLNKGVGPDQVALDLRRRVGVSRSRSLLIATNELGNASAHAQQETLKELGVKRYRWRTSQDTRVRASHRERNGKVYSWDKPPAGGMHPGEEIRCRCVALGIVPGEVARDE